MFCTFQFITGGFISAVRTFVATSFQLFPSFLMTFQYHLEQENLQRNTSHCYFVPHRLHKNTSHCSFVPRSLRKAGSSAAWSYARACAKFQSIVPCTTKLVQGTSQDGFVFALDLFCAACARYHYCCILYNLRDVLFQTIL